MASPSDVAFVLVPGSFAGPIFYHKVTKRLESDGYTVVAVTLPSAGDRSPQPPGTMYDDAELIREEITKLLDSGKHVIVAMNSYGGIPGTEATKGLSWSERGEGKKAVVALVYIAAMLLPEGMSSNGMMTQQGAPASPPGDGPYMYLESDAFAPLIFSDMSEPEYMPIFLSMPPQSRISFDQELTHGGYKHIPSTYILPGGDRIIAPEFQHRMIDSINEGVEDAKKIQKVVFPGNSHVPMLSVPDEVIKVLLEAAGTGVAL